MCKLLVREQLPSNFYTGLKIYILGYCWAAPTQLSQGHCTAVAVREKQQYLTPCILLVTGRWSHICQKSRRKKCVFAPQHPHQSSLSLFMQVWLFCWGCQDQQINTDIEKRAMLRFDIPCIYHFISSQESVEFKKKIKERVTRLLSGVSSV